MKQSKNIKMRDKSDCFFKYFITIPIEPYFEGNYRLEYDGKRITLFGKDSRYEAEDLLLTSVDLDILNATPTIKEVNDTEVIIELNKK